MLTINDLADSLGLSEPQVRRRLKALNGVIDDHVKRGEKSKIKVDSSGLELLRRLETLHKEGLTFKEASAEIKEELGDSTVNDVNEKDVNRNVNQREIDRKVEAKDEVIQELRDRVQDLQEDKRELRNQLERKDNRIQQLLPSVRNTKKYHEDDFKELGLIQVIKKWFTTKT